jgi:hypothetical protein
VEIVFGIHVARFSFLRNSLSPDKVETVVLTCVYLHNFLRRNANARIAYSPPGAFDAEEAENGTFTPGSWRQETGKEECFLNLQNIPRRTNNFPQDIRKQFMEYFFYPEGSVPWQDEYA